MQGTITKISELINGNNSNYVKVFIDDLPFNLFINSQADKTIWVNLKEGYKVNYEVGENQGFKYLTSINQVITKDNNEINFKMKLSNPNNNKKIEVSERERLIIMQTCLKCISMNAKTELKPIELMERARELYNLLIE